MTENKSYRLYDSLEFFWNKKIWFIIIPIVVALLGFVGSMLIPKDGDYVGKSIVFTGSVKIEALTNPEHIMTMYGKHFTGNTDVFVPTRSYIKTETYGNNKEEVTKELNQFNDQLFGALMDQYNKIIAGTENYAKIQAERIETLKTAVEAYKGALASTDNVTVNNNYAMLLSAAEMDLTNALATEQRVKNDILVYEKPNIAKATTVVKTKSYGLEGTIAGFIFGILITIFVLSLWKYILEARGSKRA
ncbi:hypothetical protein PB01_04615 [Psychrobacillus glaciei]|uniref:Lipopolysaccharide biosynthesis protein n=1 Tax=Psychrobacillus glaciei TaxID=2283160 RepID=A0A5J6SKB9_9BACI|nr:hypothetical protein [Psychrobacillus glaciei]QFF98159.1 hypothetical protein PB01_04615 [Psychrobacillus glaciei]